MANNCQLPQFLPPLPTQDQPEKAKYAPLTNHRGCSTSSWPPTASSSPQLPLGVHLSPPLMMKPPPPLPSLRLCQHASEGAAFLLEQAKHTALLVLIYTVFISTHFTVSTLWSILRNVCLCVGGPMLTLCVDVQLSKRCLSLLPCLGTLAQTS